MRAVVYTTYGPPEVLTIKEVDTPTIADDEMLIKVYATTVNRTDCGLRSARYFISRLVTGLFRPKRQIGGSEFAGKVEKVGTDVTEFQVGDRVFGFEDVRSGGHAEFKAQRADGSVAKIPKGFDFKQVAPAGEGATYALSYIRSAGITKGQHVLVYGASGAIGSAGVQLLKHIGAEVTAVCGTKNVQKVQPLGADRVIDYQKQDFTTIDERFDLVFDAVGKSSYGACKKLLKPTGKYCSTELGRWGQNPLLAVWFAITRSHRVLFPLPKINKETIQYVAESLQNGSYKPLIDRVYPLEDIVEATRYVETEQKTGNVVIRVVR
jgi:NADPH:quinone reductase-like Zn-dependent oxidoreductase